MSKPTTNPKYQKKFLADLPEILVSAVNISMGSTNIRSTKIVEWKCNNLNHPNGVTKEWKEMSRSRVCYKWCPVCSPRCKRGGKCIECEKRAVFNYPYEKM